MRMRTTCSWRHPQSGRIRDNHARVRGCKHPRKLSGLVPTRIEEYLTGFATNKSRFGLKSRLFDRATQVLNPPGVGDGVLGWVALGIGGIGKIVKFDTTTVDGQF